jgi:hypothetical protein
LRRLMRWRRRQDISPLLRVESRWVPGGDALTLPLPLPHAVKQPRKTGRNYGPKRF